MLRFFRKKPANPPADDAAKPAGDSAGQDLPVRQDNMPQQAAPEAAAPDVIASEAQSVAPSGTGAFAAEPDTALATPAPAGTVFDEPAFDKPTSDEPAQIASAVAEPSAAEPVITGPAAPARAEPAAASWRERLRNSGFAKSFSTLFSRQPALDEDFLEELETCLLTADVGIAATTIIIDDLRQRMARNEFNDARGLLDALRGELIALLVPVAEPLNIYTGAKPFVILTVGVNGVGKTTTIGKLARRYLDERKSIMLAAGDTFRAAAVEQLKTWGERNGVHVAAQANGADPAAVVYDALQTARARNVDLLIADTAGRLHTQQGLMDELGKIKRVLGKLDPTAPHEVLQVIDGTTGQNAINQVRHFHKAAGVSGLIVTKLDGSAKGGVIFALAREFGLPIRYVGLGEGVHDLRAFDPYAFVDALLPESLVTR
ncbi:signal recognition particle-docking protein FtsY [Denitratimonas sp. CY0512]|uniref:signal recognition particle-docking protein FtsY n=1 Tax=Denitratimonas sp. CY0512 TaxID=3131940 RepID=UPI0030A624C6